MSAKYFDQLEAELRAAVPRANARRVGWWRRPLRRNPALGGLAVAFSVAVTLVVVLLAVGLVGHRREPVRPPTLGHRSVGSYGGSEYPVGAVPTLGQLLANFAILRRSQTSQDLSGRNLGGGPVVKRLTRLARTLPGGYRIYLEVMRPAPALTITIVDRSGNGSGTFFGPNTQYNVYPVPTAGNDAVWASVIPDGVTTVRWTFSCPPARPDRRPCGIRPRTYTLPVINNVAAARIPVPGHTPGLQCTICGRAPQVVWLSANGQVAASFGRGYNLAAPPFVAGGRGYRLLRALQSDAVGGARLGEPWREVTEALTSLLGPPAAANIPASSCSVGRESVWTSPAVAQPLTIFERRGRFVGYQYGAPVQEIGLQPGPGAVLATSRGLTLADTIGTAKRLYGDSLVTSTTGGGTWRVIANGGTLRGAVLPITYPLRIVTAQNPVATIQAGTTGCLVTGPG